MRPLSKTPNLPDFPGVPRKKSRHVLILLGVIILVCLVAMRTNYWEKTTDLGTSRSDNVQLDRKASSRGNETLAFKSLERQKDDKKEVTLDRRKDLGLVKVKGETSLRRNQTGRTSPPPTPVWSTAMPLLIKAEYLHNPNWKQLKNLSLGMNANETLSSRTQAPVNTAKLNSKYVDPFKYFTFENAPFDQYALNVPLSQSLPLHRSFPEIRCRQCLGRKYPQSRPHKVSIVVPFHNEMWAVLVRTVHSLLDHSPPDLLHEIIMVDDFSNFDNLLAPLAAYLKILPKVKLIRLKQREGLIRARMAGARIATGDLLSFIDAHVEVAVGWLEPLVDLVARERTTIAVPVVNSVDPLSFQYIHVSLKSTGVFTWDLDYVWKDQNISYERIGVAPHPTATMIGCSFLVDREFFFNVGSFDEGMDVWGGEQIEISFRTWMCGGSVKIVPCSHVGHIYRAHLPYAFDKYILYRNLQRIAEVWMDDYKRYYYYTIQADPHKFTPQEHLTVQGRKDLRRKLQCKPFSWYLQKLAPDITTPTIGAILFGNVRNVGSQMCLCQKNTTKFDFCEVGFEFCSLQTKEVTFEYMDSGHLMYNGKCLAYRDTKESAVSLALCDQNDSRQLWQFRPGLPPVYQSQVLGADVKRTQGSFQLKYGGYSLCLSQMLHQGTDIAGALDCGAANVHQYWIVTYQLNYNRNFRDVYPDIGINK